MKEFTGSFLLGSVILLSVLIFFCMIRAIKGPRFTDRVVAGNMISTMIIVILSILSVYMEEPFLVDVAIGNCSAPGTRKGGTGRWKTLELLLASF